jgi:orotidine-5'-phosphate decarboxylase
MGSDFLIVGRTIINAKNPVREAEKIRKTLLKL